MVWKPGTSGNPAGRAKDKVARTALVMALKEAGEDMPRLRTIMTRVIAEAEKGEAWAVTFIADRLDGKPAQVHIGDEEEDAIKSKHTVVERVIVHHHQIDDSDEPDLYPTIGTA